jgi:DNA polymerase III epsilon subunit-like protein
MARSLGLPGKLGDLAAALGVSLVDAHQALDDTRALAEVLIKLLEKGAAMGEIYQFQPPLFAPEPSGLFHLRPI